MSATRVCTFARVVQGTITCVEICEQTAEAIPSSPASIAMQKVVEP